MTPENIAKRITQTLPKAKLSDVQGGRSTDAILRDLSNSVQNSTIETCCKVVELYCEDKALAETICARLRDLKGSAS